MVKKFRVIIVILFLLLSICSLSSLTSTASDDDYFVKIARSASSRAPQIDNTDRGGSWVDSFSDTDGIATSNNIAIREGNVIISTGTSASLTTILISIPDFANNFQWDSFALNKTESANAYINISILDGSTNTVIPGFDKITTDGELDISDINVSIHPSLKLSATLEAPPSAILQLHYWGVSWLGANVWRDTFFGGRKLAAPGPLLVADSGNSKFLRNYNGWDLVYESHNGFTSDSVAYMTIDPHPYAGPTNNGDGTWDIQISIRIETDFFLTEFGATIDFYRGIVNSVSGDGITKIDQDSIMFNRQLILWASRDYYIYLTVEDTAAAKFNCTQLGRDLNTYLVNTVAHTGSAPFVFYFTLADMQTCSKAKAEHGPFYFYKDSTITKSITLPANSYWGTLIANKTEYSKSKINITVLDATTNNPIPGFESRTDTELDLFMIDPKAHPSIKFQVNFKSDGYDTPVLHDLSINWTSNKFPKILSISPSEDSVYRTNTVPITIDAYDNEDASRNLTLDLSFQTPATQSWQTIYFSNQKYDQNTGVWSVDFTPESNADLGFYTFRINIQDQSNGDLNIIFPDLLEVLNNKPTQPELEIVPPDPTTLDDLVIKVYNVTDIDEEPIIYKYEWHKDNDLQSDLVTDLVPSDRTFKNEIWKCIVTPNDGNEDGAAGEIEVTIQNTAPQIIKSIEGLNIQEDTVDITSINLLDIFEDPDEDVMSFSKSGDNKISVQVFNANGTVKLTPNRNWHGTEEITFIANDGDALTLKPINITVLPTNDRPHLKKLGDKFIEDLQEGEELEFTVNEGEWLNATIQAEDIDGDEMTFVTNLTDNIGEDDRENFYLEGNEISFQPENGDVGTIFINLTISDGNGSGEVYFNFRVNVLNTNNAPTVQITVPIAGKKFKETDEITFKCVVDDPDLKVAGYNERFSYIWMTNLSGEPLATGTIGVDLSEITTKLPLGRQTITVYVTDSNGLEDSGSVNIVVTPVEEDSMDFFSEYWWLWLLIIIVIIILLVISVLVIRKKRERKFKALLKEEGRVPRLQPEITAVGLGAAVKTGAGALGGAGAGRYTQPQMALPVPAAHPYGAAARAATVPQLPPRGGASSVTNDEMMNLLELRLAKGEIDLETYKKLSRKYEGRPSYGVTPQQQRLLPPAPAAKPVVQPTVASPSSPPPTPPSTTPQPTVKTPTVSPASVQPQVQPSTTTAPPTPTPKVKQPTPTLKTPKVEEK